MHDLFRSTQAAANCGALRAYVYTWERGDWPQSYLHLLPSLPRALLFKGLILETAGVPAALWKSEPSDAAHLIQLGSLCKMCCSASPSPRKLTQS